MQQLLYLCISGCVCLTRINESALTGEIGVSSDDFYYATVEYAVEGLENQLELEVCTTSKTSTTREDDEGESESE